MLLPIHDRLQVSDIQERFSNAFPGLKIEFCSRRRLKGNQMEKYIISPDKRIGEIRHNMNEGVLEINSGFSATRLEKNFHEQFGLQIQLYWNNHGNWEHVPFMNHKSLAYYEVKARTSVSGVTGVQK
jgi:hypothetical protein